VDAERRHTISAECPELAEKILRNGVLATRVVGDPVKA